MQTEHFQQSSILFVGLSKFYEAFNSKLPIAYCDIFVSIPVRATLL